MSGPSNSAVSVFHFTSTISTAKIRKYKQATERGMAPFNGSRTSHANQKAKSAAPNTTDAGPSGEASTSMEPPTKKLRLKINGPRKPDDVGDTIAVSRPKKPAQNIRFRYSTDMSIAEEPLPEGRQIVESSQAVLSPAPSSGLSSLSSAPPSEKEVSPFEDPKPVPGRQDYGDFMSYYVVGGDEEPAPVEDSAHKAASKAASKPARSKKVKTTSSKPPTPAAQQPASSMPPPVSDARPAPPPQNIQHPPHAMPPPQYQGPPLPHQGSPSYPPRPQQMPRPPIPQPPPPRALPPPQPIIQFPDINHIPKPTKPDTIALMIKKLEDLSAALTFFGGAPRRATTPPIAPKAPVVAPPQPKPAPKSPAAESANPLDNFLSLFGGGDDDDASDKDPLDCQLADPGTPDGPLTHGIVFIQNALKSWAQQRISSAYQQQYLQQQQQHQIAAQRRGPGRPRKFDEVIELLPPNPVISMDLASTPEGEAIIAFQAVLHSGCLQVNAKLPIELSRALRHLYMQIDHLINQGEKSTPQEWHCMSYGAQISAHAMRVEKHRMAQMRAQEEMMRQHGLSQQNMMAMGAPHHLPYPINAAQAARAHEMELERRRSVQHANMQPYNRQQHLNPLQLGSPTLATPNNVVPPPSGHQTPGSAGPPGPHNGERPPMHHVPPHPHLDPAQMSPGGSKSGGGAVQLDKMKLYMPGYLPRTGQSMKFSFAPHSEHAVQMFGTQAFPPNQYPGHNMPNRGPMSAPPLPQAHDNGHVPPPDHNLSASANAIGHTDVPVKSVEAPQAPLLPPPRNSLTPLTPAAGTTEPIQNGNFRSYTTAPQRSVPAINGFTPVNASKPQPSIPVSRTAPSESPETIRVASKRPSAALSSSESPGRRVKRTRKSVRSDEQRDDSKAASSKSDHGDGEVIVVA